MRVGAGRWIDTMSSVFRDHCPRQRSATFRLSLAPNHHDKVFAVVVEIYFHRLLWRHDSFDEDIFATAAAAAAIAIANAPIENSFVLDRFIMVIS